MDGVVEMAEVGRGARTRRRSRVVGAIGVVIGLLAAACTAADVADPAANRTVDAVTKAELAKSRDFLAPPTASFLYGPEKGQQLEVYPPVAGGNVGVLVWFPGGGFADCDLKSTRTKAHVLRQRRRGWAIVSACYRTNGWNGDPKSVLFPAPHLDAGAVVNLVRTEGQERWALNPRRVGVGGHSAGGNVAGLLATAANATTGPLAGKLPKVDGWISEAGVLDMQRHDWPGLWATFLLGDNRKLDATASVSRNVDAGDPPGYLIHGDDDAWTPHEVAEWVKDADRAGRIRYDLVDVDDRGRSLGHYRGHGPFGGASATAFDAYLAERAR